MSAEARQLWETRLSIPSYRVGEAASYARVAPQTVTAWHKRKIAGKPPLLSTKQPREGISFLQLIELAVVADMRKLGVKLHEIELARAYFKKETGLDFPFAKLRFKTDGADVFSEIEGDLGEVIEDKVLSANHGGQYTWTEMLTSRFAEFNYDDSGAVIAWKVAGPDKDIEINPKLAFGAPQIGGIKTGILRARWIAGEEVDEIAEDFALSEQQVLQALTFEGIEPSESRLSRWMH
ncbi:hypothetical protein [uncultured Marivita sp.]|uniref:DUF433 domain-containing protein n=1 Tax=uncultured Marivita sp. TaxID=888080 RepID=UPI00261756B3|nr:hypothetical protein [uncultured Marivita sp.]